MEEKKDITLEEIAENLGTKVEDLLITFEGDEETIKEMWKNGELKLLNE